MTAKLAIDVRGLTKRFGHKTAVNGIDIAVPEGEVWGFLGPNGSGKTTTIRMLCGLLHADAGSGTCLGYDITRQTDQIKREVGYMTQSFSHYTDLTVSENLDFIAQQEEFTAPDIFSVGNREKLVFKSEARIPGGMKLNPGQPVEVRPFAQ